MYALNPRQVLLLFRCNRSFSVAVGWNLVRNRNKAPIVIGCQDDFREKKSKRRNHKPVSGSCQHAALWPVWCRRDKTLTLRPRESCAAESVKRSGMLCVGCEMSLTANACPGCPGEHTQCQPCSPDLSCVRVRLVVTCQAATAGELKTLMKLSGIQEPGPTC